MENYSIYIIYSSFIHNKQEKEGRKGKKETKSFLFKSIKNKKLAQNVLFLASK